MVNSLQGILTGEKFFNENGRELYQSHVIGYNSPNTQEEFKFVFDIKSKEKRNNETLTDKKILVKVQPEVYSTIGKGYSKLRNIDSSVDQEITVVGLKYMGNCYSYHGRREEISGILKKETVKINIGEVKEFFILYGIKR